MGRWSERHGCGLARLAVLALCLGWSAIAVAQKRTRPWQRKAGKPKPASTWKRPTATTDKPAGNETPFEKGEGFSPRNCIDELALTVWKTKGITPANPCSETVFVRRAFLDVIGTLPTARETQPFLDDPNPEKRSALINALMERDEFADYWSLKWCDLLRVKAEFPINLWPNAVQAYHHWIRESVAQNKPYDQFARELLTSSGSNFRVAPVNVYRAIQGQEPSTIAGAIALTFMGTRLDAWPKAEREGMEAFFSRVAYKGTAEWKEQIVFLDPAATTPVNATFPGGAHCEHPRGRRSACRVRRLAPGGGQPVVRPGNRQSRVVVAARARAHP